MSVFVIDISRRFFNKLHEVEVELRLLGDEVSFREGKIAVLRDCI